MLRTPRSGDLLCIGHRGACGHEPENTLRSIRRALELGVDGIEIDVQFVDGELVVFHDARLERTTDGHGYLRRKRFAHLRTLDAGHGERIPTLREVCELMGGRAFLNIELKSRQTADPVAALIEELVAAGAWAPADFLVSSFLRRELRRFRTLANPDVRIGLLLVRRGPFFLRTARRLGAWAVHPPLRFTTARLVEEAHRGGLKVFPYTVNEVADLARLRALGVDGVFTDFPERLENDG